MKKWQTALAAALVAIVAMAGIGAAPSVLSAEKDQPFETVNLTELENGEELYGKLMPVVVQALELSDEDAAEVSAESFYEVDLGNYPKGYTRQFIAFVYNYEWIELVLVAANDDASLVKVLDRSASSDEGDMFLNTAKLEFSTEGNYLYVWSQAPYSAYESIVELEWAGDRFYYASHVYDDPTARYYAEKADRLKAKDLNGLIELAEEGYPLYPGSYEETFTLAGPVLKLAQQQANKAHKKYPETALRYLEYGLEQYAEAYGTWGYVDGTLKKAELTDPERTYSESRLTLGAYVAALNDYGYYLYLNGQNKQAKPVLVNVVKLVPSRTVAYLNLADVEWKLGQREAAKTHYKQYLKLLGSKASAVAPKRAKERMNSK